MTPRIPRKSLEAQLLEAKTELDAAKAKYDKLAEAARTLLSMGHHIDGFADVQLTPNRTWNKAKAFESWGEDICTPQVDQVLAKKVMTGAEYDSYYIEGPARVVVKNLDE